MPLILPIGPQHPALKEAVNFKVEVEGEDITGADIRLGYNHRGIEILAEKRTYYQDIYLFERICGICSHSHPTCFVQAVEDIIGVEVPKRAEYIRVIIGELERIHSHLLWAGVAAHELGFDTLLMYIWRDREISMDLLEMISGNRVNYAMNTIGGVRRDIPEEKIPMIKEKLDALIPQLDMYADVFTRDPTLRARLEGKGVLDYRIAKDLCAVGPTARASGVDSDIRRDDPYASYEDFDFDVPVLKEGDNMARVVQRVLELYECVKIMNQALDNLSEGPIKAEIDEIPPGEAVGRYEAPRGEDIHYVVSNGTMYPERVKVRAPTYNNLLPLGPMLIGDTIAEIPITIASVDPCFSCTQRITIVEDKKEKIMMMDELRRMK
jgi:NADH-quinone oxidoreductase subunit D